MGTKMKPKLKKNVEKASSAVEKETGLNENNTQETKMKPKLKKNVEKASSAVEKETDLNENNTQEIKDLINELGLDKFTPETIDQLAPSKAEKPKKSSKSAKAKVSSQETDDKVPTLVPIVKPKTAKNAPPAKKVFNKKTTFGDTNSKITF